MYNTKTINPEDFILVGGGRWVESFNHRENPDIMLKLYAPEHKQMALDEYDRAQKVYGLGIPTPEPGELVESPDGRKGMIFRRIPGKKSFARAVGENPERADEFASRFASMCKELHATTVPEGMFPPVAEKYHRVVNDYSFLPKEDKETINRFIDRIPVSYTALHGDLHYGNVIFSGDNAYFIDLGEFGYGYPILDFGMAMISMRLMREEPMKLLNHMDKATSIRFWDTFLKGYFGTDRPVEDIEEEILPFAAIRAIYIQTLDGRIIPPFQQIVLDALEKGYFLG